MPVSYRIDSALGVVFTKGEGRVTDEEALAYQDQVCQDAAFDPAFNQILDLADVTEFAVSSETIRTLARRTPLLPSARRAVVAKSDLVYGMVRMFLSYSDVGPEQGQIFASVAEARRWLIPEPTNPTAPN